MWKKIYFSQKGVEIIRAEIFPKSGIKLNLKYSKQVQQKKATLFCKSNTLVKSKVKSHNIILK